MESVNTEFAQWLVTLGVGGVLAGFMFIFYRKDVKQYTELWKAQAVNMESLIRFVTEVVLKNTESNTQLIVLIEEMKSNQMRKADIQELLTNGRSNKTKKKSK